MSKKNKNKVSKSDSFINLKSKVELLVDKSNKQSTQILLQEKKIQKLKAKLATKKRSLLITIYLPIFIGVLGLFYTYVSFHQDKKIAEASGIFMSEKSNVSLGKLILQDGKKYNVEIGFKQERNQIVFHEIPIEIYNKGEKSTKKSNLTFRYYQLHNMSIDTFMSLNLTSPFANVSHSYMESFPFEYSTFNIEEINPKMNIRINELIHINNTKMDVENDSFNISIEYGKIFDLFYTRPDTKTEHFAFSISKSNESEIDTLINRKLKYLKGKYKTKEKYNSDKITMFMTPVVNTKDVYKEINSELLVTEINKTRIKYLVFDNTNMNYIIYDNNGKIESIGRI